MDNEDTRSIEALRAELAANRQSLASAMGDVVESVRPENVARRTVDGAKSFVRGEFESAKAGLRDENGWRTDRLAIIGGVAVGIIVVAVALSRMGRHR